MNIPPSGIIEQLVLCLSLFVGPFCFGIAGRTTDYEQELRGQGSVWCYSSEENCVMLGAEKIAVTKPATIRIGDIFVSALFFLVSAYMELNEQIGMHLRPTRDQVFPQWQPLAL